MNKLFQSSLIALSSLALTACDQSLLNEDIAGEFGESLQSLLGMESSDVSITGAAVKGPLINADVTAYILDPNAIGLKGDIVGRGTTNGNARLNLRISESQIENAPLLLEFTGGTELNGSIPVIPVLRTIVQYSDITQGTPVYATPLSTFILAHAEQQADRPQDGSDVTQGLVGNGDGEISHSELLIALAVSQHAVRTTFGLDALPTNLDLFRTAPLLNNEQDQDVAVALRSANEVFASLVGDMQANALANGLTIDAEQLLNALADDFTDGQFDKRNSDGHSLPTLNATGDFAVLFSTNPETRDVPGTELAVQDLPLLMAQEALDLNDDIALTNVSAPNLNAPRLAYGRGGNPNNGSGNNNGNNNGNGGDDTPASAPSVAFVAPVSGSIFTEGSAVSVSVNASDADNDLTQCSLRLNGQLVGNDRSAPYLWNSNAAALSNLSAGSYTAEVSCVDSTNLSASVSRSFAVVAPAPQARPPVVSFTQPSANISLIAGSSVAVDLNVSDPENNVDRCRLTINNTLVGVDSSAPFSWSNNSALNNLSAGNYSLAATCTDDTDLSHSVSRNFVVSAPPPPPASAPQVSFSSPSNGLEIEEGDALTVRLNASDADNDISQCSLIINGVLISNDRSAPYQWSSSSHSALNDLSAGTYTLDAICLDGSNLSDAAQRQFVVTEPEPDPVAPTVSFASPSNGLTITSNDSIQVIVNANDPDGDVAYCDLSLNGQLVRRDSNAPFVWDDLSDSMLDNMNPGSYTLTASCRDSANLSDTASRGFTVAEPEPEPSAPVVSFATPSGNMSITEGDAISIS
ncbi:hypothetical protein GYB62_00770, partial [bacterium]|nr:hypothetical protein [bacterium]